MRSSRSLALKRARSVGACLAVLAAWTLLDRAILTPAAAQTSPAVEPPALRGGDRYLRRMPNPRLRRCRRRSIASRR
jgi:hypothetical protein